MSEHDTELLITVGFLAVGVGIIELHKRLREIVEALWEIRRALPPSVHNKMRDY